MVEVTFSTTKTSHRDQDNLIMKDLGGYGFFWSGRPLGQRREDGFGFAIKITIANRLWLWPLAINDRLMIPQMSLSSSRHVT